MIYFTFTYFLHLIRQMTNYDWPFGTLLFRRFWSNVDTMDLETYPIPNAKFPPITALLNIPTYHKSANVSPPPFPQISWEPQINE